ncbi:MAG: T9SS type A sorting domain-containing protein [Bacteroidales bacterium]|nr:T9SS type A sorting domain-containing protein [Bacteroidales bacterium]
MKKFFIFLTINFLVLSVKAQLPNGDIAPNWTLKDINGNNHTLYNYLDQGKRVVIDFSAVWCNPCWSYHTSGALKTLYNQYGPNGTVNQTMMVFFIEGDEGTIAQLNGGSGSVGNWVQGTPYPIIATCPPPDGNGSQVSTAYNISYFPTVYTVCPDRTIYESGQKTAAQHYTFANSTCAPLTTTNNDVKAFKLTTPNYVYCGGSFTPTLIVQNYGNANLTSFTINVLVDGNVTQTTQWTGNLARYETANIVLNAISGLSDGQHTISVELSNPNNANDENPANNTISKTVTFMNTPYALPLTQSFSGNTFPPTGYDVIDATNDGYKWKRSSTAGYNGAGSMYIDFYNISSGNYDDFIFPLVSFNNISNPQLTFYIAHRRYSASYSDKLQVDVSTNCGQSWTQKWMKSGAQLATNSSYLTSEYTSPASTDWRQETVDLSSYQGMSNILIRFRATSGYGNNCFVDEINLTGTSDNNIINIDGSIEIYPNPTNNNFFIINAEHSNIEILDITGKVIYTQPIYDSVQQINIENICNGTYFVRIMNNDQITIKKLIVNN